MIALLAVFGALAATLLGFVYRYFVMLNARIPEGTSFEDLVVRLLELPKFAAVGAGGGIFIGLIVVGGVYLKALDAARRLPEGGGDSPDPNQLVKEQQAKRVEAHLARRQREKQRERENQVGES